jgi:hypothetical protein
MIEIDQLPKVAKDTEFLAPPRESLEIAKRIARISNSLGLSEPSFDVREKGDIEVFSREDTRGLLIIIQPNGQLLIFGHFGGEQWRARYGASGSTWEVHLRRFMQDILPVPLNSRKRSAAMSF